MISWNLFDPAFKFFPLLFAALPLKPPKRSDIERLRSNTRTMIKSVRLRTSSSNIDIQIRLVMIQFFLNVVGINQFGFSLPVMISILIRIFLDVLNQLITIQCFPHGSSSMHGMKSVQNINQQFKSMHCFCKSWWSRGSNLSGIKTSSPSRSGIRMSSLF